MVGIIDPVSWPFAGISAVACQMWRRHSVFLRQSEEIGGGSVGALLGGRVGPLANLQHQGTIAALHEQEQDAIFSRDFA